MSYRWDMDRAISHILSMPWEDPGFYAGYLSQVYHYVSHSTRMLAAAAAVTESPEYYKRLIAHIREEEGHEKMAAADLKQLGHPIGEELGVTRALWEPQFFKIQRHPEALLGYILALELAAIEMFPNVLPRVKAAHGDRCVTFARVHAEEDPNHVKEALSQIEALDEAGKERAWKNFDQTRALLIPFMDEIRTTAAERSAPRRAKSPSATRAA